MTKLNHRGTARAQWIFFSIVVSTAVSFQTNCWSSRRAIERRQNFIPAATSTMILLPYMNTNTADTSTIHAQKIIHRRRYSYLKSSNNGNNPETTSGPKWQAKFQDIEQTDNPVDAVLSLFTSDLFSAVLGMIGLIVCLINRLTIDLDATEIFSDVQSRSDILAVFASGGLLLNGLTQLDVTSVLAERVDLEGVFVEPTIIIRSDDDGLADADGSSTELIKWGLNSLLSSTPAGSAVFLRAEEDGAWSTVAIAGILPDTNTNNNPILRNGPSSDDNTPILDRFRRQKQQEVQVQETYLPTLQAIPGRSEFRYLPVNTQAALLIPVGLSDGDDLAVLVLGADTAKSFTPRDVAWCQVVAARISV